MPVDPVTTMGLENVVAFAERTGQERRENEVEEGGGWSDKAVMSKSGGGK